MQSSSSIQLQAKPTILTYQAYQAKSTTPKTSTSQAHGHGWLGWLVAISVTTDALEAPFEASLARLQTEKRGKSPLAQPSTIVSTSVGKRASAAAYELERVVTRTLRTPM
jgi:hypothetical protein